MPMTTAAGGPTSGFERIYKVCSKKNNAPETLIMVSIIQGKTDGNDDGGAESGSSLERSLG